jgi:hypothetical protein
MIERIHKHLLSELDRAGRSDTIFVLAGVSFNLLVLFINWGQAGNITSTYWETNVDSIIIFSKFLVGTVVVSTACLLTLKNSRRICNQYHQALLKIYEDTEVVRYMPEEMVGLGNKRFVLPFIVVGGTGLLAILVPIVAILAKWNCPLTTHAVGCHARYARLAPLMWVLMAAKGTKRQLLDRKYKAAFAP